MRSFSFRGSPSKYICVTSLSILPVTSKWMCGGRSLEERQPHMRGGAHAPLTRAEIEAKLAGNARSGGWTQAQIDAAHTLAKSIWHAAHIDLADLRG